MSARRVKLFRVEGGWVAYKLARGSSGAGTGSSPSSALRRCERAWTYAYLSRMELMA